MNETMLDAALGYASAGIAVFPLLPNSKKPATKHGLKDATTDEAQIRAWWKVNPNYNVGARCGNGDFVTDFDVNADNGEDGLATLREWELAHGDLPETVTAVTPRGGLHMWFHTDSKVPCSTNKEKGVDIRGDGGYVVMPPSVHPNGRRYEWESDPFEMDIARADENVLAFVESVRPSKKRGRPSKGNGTIPKGERNDTLYRMGCSLQAQGNNDDVIAAYLASVNRIQCEQPVDDDELESIIESVLKLPKGLSEEAQQAQSAKQKRVQFKHNQVARKLISEHGACMIDGVTPAIRIDGKAYELGWDAFEREIIKMHDDSKMTNRREVQAYIRVTAPRKRQSPWNLIAFNNGVLDVLTGELRDWRDDDVIANVIPHNWNPHATSELLDTMLIKMACDDLNTAFNLQEFIGICMIRSNTRLPFYPVLIGEGSNGKSTYIKLLKHVLGIENVSALQPKEISAHFMGEHIVGKLANLGDDIADAYLDGEDCGAIKRISTGESIFTDVKGTKGFYFEPYCTLVFSCNTFPKCKDTTEGFLRRLFPIEFNAHFSPDDADFDPMITEKLMSEDVLEHACALGVQGLQRAIRMNHPSENHYSSEMKRSIAIDSNNVLQWIADEELSVDYAIGKTRGEVYSDYKWWCEKNGYAKAATSSGTLVKTLATIWHISLSKVEHRTTSDGRKSVRVFDFVAKSTTQKAHVKA